MNNRNNNIKINFIFFKLKKNDYNYIKILKLIKIKINI